MVVVAVKELRRVLAMMQKHELGHEPMHEPVHVLGHEPMHVHVRVLSLER